jgi:hypothetical protein
MQIFELLMLAGRQAAHQGKAGFLAWPTGQTEITERQLNFIFSLCWIKDFSKYLHPKNQVQDNQRSREETDGAHIILYRV